MMKWEYEEINIYPENAKEELNNLGEDGWELVSINLVFGGITHGVAYFKRPALESSERIVSDGKNQVLVKYNRMSDLEVLEAAQKE